MTTKNQDSKKSPAEIFIKVKEALSEFDEVRGFL